MIRKNQQYKIMIRYILIFTAFLFHIGVIAQTTNGALFEKALNGDKKAQYILGMQYYHGNNEIKVDYAQAVYWFKKSAEQNYADAQVMIGYCYGNGKGVQEDDKQAVYWYKKAADQDDALAQYNLAIYYENGYGVTKNINEAVKWFKESARHRYAKSQRIYANYLLDGDVIKKDTLEALFWLHEAADIGGEKVSWDDCDSIALTKLDELAKLKSAFQYQALNYLGDIYYNKNELNLAVNSYKQSIKLGSIEAEASLGYLYMKAENYAAIGYVNKMLAPGKFAKEQDPDYEEFLKSYDAPPNDNACYWLEEAIKDGADEWIYDGNHMLYWYLTNSYLSTYKRESNYPKAIESLEKFIQKGGVFDGPDEDSLRLADLYYIGKIDYKKAYSIYKQYENDEYLQFWVNTALGRCYYYGNGIGQNYQVAIKYFAKAADIGDAEAMRFLSRCYRYGRGVPRNDKLANEWHQKALEHDDPEAKKLQELLE